MSAYHEGAKAFEDGIRRYMNPYAGRVTFAESWSIVPKFRLGQEWDRGWDAAADYQKKQEPK